MSKQAAHPIWACDDDAIKAEYQRVCDQADEARRQANRFDGEAERATWERDRLREALGRAELACVKLGIAEVEDGVVRLDTNEHTASLAQALVALRAALDNDTLQVANDHGQSGSLTPAETVVRGVPVTRSKPQDATERCQETDNGANDPPRAQGTGASEGRPGGPGLNRGSDSHTPLADSVPCTCFSYNPDCPIHGEDWDCGDCGKTWPPGVLSCADCLSETDKPRRARLGVPQTEERAGKPEQPDSVPTCPKCNGRGWYGVIAGDRKECRVCGGSGSSKGGEE